MKYFRRPWEEDRGDDHANWGTSVWYFEVDDSWAVLRQIEAYANGTILRYDNDHSGDEFGMLSDQPLGPKEEFLPLEISKEAFEQEWAHPAFNR